MTHTFFIKLVRSITIIVIGILPLASFALVPVTAEAAGTLDTWWPTDGATMQGVQPFKALVEGLDVSSYDMYWQVDGGQLNAMSNSSTDYAHKEATVDLSNWTWHGAGPYVITFVAKQNGATIVQKSVSIYTGAASTAVSPAPTPSTSPTSASAPQSASTPTQTAPQSPILPTPIAQPVVSAPTPVSAPAATASASVNVWWPTANASIAGTQPFKAQVPGVDANAYTMYWQVDSGQMNAMTTNTTDGAHKESLVDVSGWHWQASGLYTLTFTAKDASGATIATYSEPVLINASASAIAPTTLPAPTPAVAPSSPPAASLSDSSFYVDPDSSAATQASAWASSRPADAAMMRTLASAPTAKWFGEWSGDVKSAVSQTVNAAATAGKTAVLVAYDIPQRDCGGYSAGGTNDYLSWITSFASGIGNHSAIVVLEPDSLAQVSCLSNADQAARFTLLAKAVSILKANAGTKVYLDAGHAGWVDPATMASRLSAANLAQADGFSLNVSNYDSSASEAAYGAQVSSAAGGKHFVIDTSRNGNGSDGEWCNASGRAIGALPTTSTGNSLVDAFLWVKAPGESDGTCNGGPSAGTWWADYALSLVKNVH